MNADVSGPAPHLASPARDFCLLLPATPRGARLARHLAAGQLDAWGLPYDGEVNRTVALLVAELAANAVRHGRVRGRDFRLRVALRAEGVVRVEVTDARVDRLPPTPGTLPVRLVRGGVGAGAAPRREPGRPVGEVPRRPVHQDRVVRGHPGG